MLHYNIINIDDIKDCLVSYDMGRGPGKAKA